MNKKGPIIVIEDDPDDQEILSEVFENLGYENQLVFFFNGEEALEFIDRDDVLPFLIISDINMPRLSGLELKERIQTDAKLQLKCIPYLFFTTSASRQAVIDAYSMSSQGFFIKDNSTAELEKTIRIMIEYWQRCYAPNQFISEEERDVRNNG